MARLSVLVVLMSLLLAGGANAEVPTIAVKKTATCGCCNGWINHLKRSGFTTAAENLPYAVLNRFKTANGIRSDLASCHTARVGGYTIEGHVPAREIKRLLAERPDAVGLTVPGMPVGSPGMEVGSSRDAYDVLLIKKDGSTQVYARYEAVN